MFFLKITPCTNLSDNSLSLSSLYCGVDKWEGMMSCSRYWHTSAYQEFVMVVGEGFSTLYILISCSHREGSSSFTSTISIANRQRPWPLIKSISLNSKSYSYKPIIQFALLSPSSCRTNNDLVFEVSASPMIIYII